MSLWREKTYSKGPVVYKCATVSVWIVPCTQCDRSCLKRTDVEKNLVFLVCMVHRGKYVGPSAKGF